MFDIFCIPWIFRFTDSGWYVIWDVLQTTRTVKISWHLRTQPLLCEMVQKSCECGPLPVMASIEKGVKVNWYDGIRDRREVVESWSHIRGHARFRRRQRPAGVPANHGDCVFIFHLSLGAPSHSWHQFDTILNFPHYRAGNAVQALRGLVNWRGSPPSHQRWWKIQCRSSYAWNRFGLCWWFDAKLRVSLKNICQTQRHLRRFLILFYWTTKYQIYEAWPKSIGIIAVTLSSVHCHWSYWLLTNDPF